MKWRQGKYESHWSLFAKGVSLLGSYGGTRAELRQVLNLVARGQIKPVIHGVLPLEQLADAHRLMEARQHFGKIIIAP